MKGKLTIAMYMRLLRKEFLAMQKPVPAPKAPSGIFNNGNAEQVQYSHLDTPCSERELLNIMCETRSQEVCRLAYQLYKHVSPASSH